MARQGWFDVETTERVSSHFFFFSPSFYLFFLSSPWRWIGWNLLQHHKFISAVVIWRPLVDLLGEYAEGALYCIVGWGSTLEKPSTIIL